MNPNTKAPLSIEMPVQETSHDLATLPAIHHVYACRMRAAAHAVPGRTYRRFTRRASTKRETQTTLSELKVVNRVTCRIRRAAGLSKQEATSSECARMHHIRGQIANFATCI